MVLVECDEGVHRSLAHLHDFHHTTGLEPLVRQRRLDGDALVDVSHEQLADEVLRRLTHSRPGLGVEVKLRALDLSQRLGVGDPSKGWIAAKEHVAHHPDAPGVARFGVALALQYLRRHVVEASDLCVHPRLLLSRHLAREAEVAHAELRGPDVLVRVLEHHILRLYVAVAYSVGVQVVQCHQHCPGDDRGVVLRHLLLLQEAVQDIAALAQLQDQVQVVVVLKGLVELDDVGVVERLHDGDLPQQPVEVPAGRDLRDDLHGTVDVRGLLLRLEDLGRAAAGQLLALHLEEVLDAARVVDDELVCAKLAVVAAFGHELLAGHAAPCLVLAAAEELGPGLRDGRADGLAHLRAVGPPQRAQALRGCRLSPAFMNLVAQGDRRAAARPPGRASASSAELAHDFVEIREVQLRLGLGELRRGALPAALLHRGGLRRRIGLRRLMAAQALLLLRRLARSLRC
mmetsp:Transcript_83966/g.216105  ORF Transcript_83966/g.216105 Transcript_83966/m.216105 type:complete len:458 (-) Transcript_83966:398-1771(-)